MWKVILATVVIFSAGVITGGLLVGYSDHAGHRPAKKAATGEVRNASGKVTNQSRPKPAPNNFVHSKEFLERLDRELKLTPEQHERIGKILAAGQARTTALWKTIEPDVHAAWADTKEKIRAELTPEQKARCGAWFKAKSREPKRNGNREHPASNSPSTESSTTESQP